jgi:hypothetical protein
MIKTFTKNDVVRFAYNEVNTEERTEMERLLVTNRKFFLYYKKIVLSKITIEQSLPEPSIKSIENILNYSKSFKLSN